MADTGIGAGLPPLDASPAAARKGPRTVKQDASGQKASFGSALERTRDNERPAVDARHAERVRSRDAAADDKAGERKSEQGDALENEGGTATRRNRPTIDLRLTGRAAPATAAANGVLPETAEGLAAGTAAITVAKLPKTLRAAGQGAPLEDEAEIIPGDAGKAPARGGRRENHPRPQGHKAGRGDDAGGAKRMQGLRSPRSRPAASQARPQPMP